MRHLILLILAILLLTSCAEKGGEIESLRAGFTEPPLEARPRALWDWVDGNFSLTEITREMEEAAAMGMGGFDIWDVRSVVDEEDVVPEGPAFMSEKSVEAIVHAINEAERLGLDLGLIIASGWNAGGAWTLPRHQTMGLFISELKASEGNRGEYVLPFPELPDMAGKPGRQMEAFIPKGKDGLPLFYKDVAVLALGYEDGILAETRDLSERMSKDGKLYWEAPEGDWVLRRYVCTNTGQPMISSTPNSKGPMIDHFNAEASELHIRYFIDKLEAALDKPLAESGLTYFYTDSYEVQGLLWTPAMMEEFETRMGYSMLPWLPAVAGEIVESEMLTRRFLYDFRRVLSDLIIENHYAHTREICEEHGVGFVAEAAGPGWPVHNCPFESLKSSGSLSFPRGEFWHLPSNNDHWKSMWGTEREHHFLVELDVIKGVASASHIYDQKYVEAEAFTGIHLWNEGPGDLKPTADRAFAEGLNRINFHTWPHTPENAGTPGWAYAFGTLINENRIWWPHARPFMDYLGRCSFLLQQGQFHGDLLCYYGDSVPNFVPAKEPLKELGFGYDYDVCNSDILLNKLYVEDGRLKLPHGPVYEALLLPGESYMQPEILEKIIELLDGGALIAGPRPSRSHGLKDWEQRDSLVRKMAAEHWERVIPAGQLAEHILKRVGIADLSYQGSHPVSGLDFLHRRIGDTDAYFVINKLDQPLSGSFTFRQEDKGVELWNPDGGSFHKLEPVSAATQQGTTVELSMDAHGSCFVVFSPELEGPGTRAARPGIAGAAASEDDADWIPTAAPAAEKLISSTLLEGPWSVDFPKGEDGPGKLEMRELLLWNQHPDSAVQFFSGIAAYRVEVDGTPEMEGKLVLLELDELHETARILVNGQEAGIIWTRPFRMDISGMLNEGRNELRIEVANTWANALAWNGRLAPGERRTRTNVTRLPNAWHHPFRNIPNEEYGLLDSGIAGKVKISIYDPAK